MGALAAAMKAACLDAENRNALRGGTRQVGAAARRRPVCPAMTQVVPAQCGLAANSFAQKKGDNFKKGNVVKQARSQTKARC